MPQQEAVSSTEGTLQPTPRAPALSGGGDRSCSARRTTTSFTMHASASVHSASAERRSDVQTPRQQPLTSKLLEGVPETSLAWPTPRRGATSTGRPSGRTPSQSGIRGDASTNSGTTSGTSSRCRSANIVTPHRAPIPAPPPLLDVGRGSISGPATTQYTSRPPHSLDLTPLGGQTESWNYHVHPSEAPSATYEAEAAAMSKASLVSAVRALRDDVRLLHTTVARNHAQLTTLQDGMSKLYVDVERQQESIANTLFRRIHRVKRAKERLQAELQQIESEKAERKAKLAETIQSVGRVKKHMKHEEDAMMQRLEEKLRRQQQQREQLDTLVEEHAASLQTLERLVNEVQTMDIPSLAISASEISSAATTAAATPLKRNSTLSTSSASAPRSPRSAMGPPTGSATAIRQGVGVVSPSAPTPRGAPASPPPVTPPPPSGPTLAQSGRHERSMSQLSATSSTVAAELPAHDPRDMVAYLEQEIAAVESLRQDVVSRANAYEEKCLELRRRIDQGARAKGEGKRRLSLVEQALEDTSTRATALAVAQQLQSEVESERMMNEALAEGRTPMQIASACGSAAATPQHSFARSPNLTAAAMPPALSLSVTHHTSTPETSSADLCGSNVSTHHTQRASQLSVQSTSRMEPPRPVVSSSDTTPSRTPQNILPDVDAPPPPLNL